MYINSIDVKDGNLFLNKKMFAYMTIYVKGTRPISYFLATTVI